MFNPLVTVVSPSPIPVLSESITVVAAAPLVIAPVALIERSLAVIDSVLPPVLNVALALILNVPVLSLASVSASMVVNPAVVRLSSIVIPSAAFSVSVPAPVSLPVVAPSVIDPADVSVKPVAKSILSAFPSLALFASPSRARLPTSVVRFTVRSISSSACASSALNVEAVVAKLIRPVASSVVVPLMLLLLAALMLFTVTLPPVWSVKPVAVISCSSAPLMFKPLVTAVAPRPIPVPSESISVVAAAPLFKAPLVFKLRSFAVT